LENTEQLKHMIEEVESLALNDDTWKKGLHQNSGYFYDEFFYVCFGVLLMVVHKCKSGWQFLFGRNPTK
jgi:hypothetical protein